MAIKILLPNPTNACTCVNHLGKTYPFGSHSFGYLSFSKTIQSFSPKSPFLSACSSAALMSFNFSEKNVSAAPPNLSHLWREIQGLNNWDNLIDPLHPLVRQEIIRYGQFVTSCYKAFDLDPNSKRFLSCKFGKNNMLKHVGMPNSGYDITKYIYATPDIKIPAQMGPTCGRWIGFIAVSSDETVKKLGRRDILITFRGTVTHHEWIANLMSSLTPARLDPNNPRPEVQVESGFLSLYTSDESDEKFGIESCRQQLLSEISRLCYVHKGEEVSISMAGHSMGSSLALLLAYDVSELGLNRLTGKVSPVTVFSFGGPRVGNAGFKERCEELGVKVLRIVNVNDPITKLPGIFLNENFRVLAERFELPWSCSCYAHVGVELLLDFFNMQNPSCVHDLEAYIGSLLIMNNKESDAEDVDFVGRLKEVLTGAGGLNIFSSVFNFVQSQRGEILFDEKVYILMNNLASYIPLLVYFACCSM